MLYYLTRVIYCGLLSFIACLLGTLISYLFQGEGIAKTFFIYWVVYFNGIIIAGLGWGVVWFGLVEGKNVLLSLLNTLRVPEALKPELFILAENATSFKYLIRSCYTLPVFITGAAILFLSEYPLTGFAKVYIAFGSISLYLAGSIGFGFIIFTIRLFRKLELHFTNISIDKWALIKNFDSLNSFFILSAAFATAALIAAFRGTLTAGFSFPIPVLQKFLTFPLVLFLPAILFYSFYPRYVFRKIFDHDIYNQIEKLEIEIERESSGTFKEKLEIKKILADVKEKMILERKSIPIVSFKDTFSVAMAIVMLLQLFFQKDPILKQYIDLIISTSLK